MKLFLDSANLDEIKKVKEYGLLDGVTTNPSLIKKAALSRKKKGSMESYINAILRTSRGVPVSLEVIGDDYASMVKEGELLYKKFNKVAKNVYVKIPINPCMTDKCSDSLDSIKAIRTLAKKGIPVNCTLIFTPEQALLAAKAGAKMVSPFVGRIDDYLRNKNKIMFEKKDYFSMFGIEKRGKLINDEGIVSGIDLVAKIIQIFDRYAIKTKVLAASIRNKRQLREAALVGADICTIPFSVIEELSHHTKTKEGMINFTKDTVKEYKDIFYKK